MVTKHDKQVLDKCEARCAFCHYDTRCSVQKKLPELEAKSESQEE